jgi:hypothetical protein
MWDYDVSTQVIKTDESSLSTHKHFQRIVSSFRFNIDDAIKINDLPFSAFEFDIEIEVF